MSVTLLVISPLASVRGPDCNEKQSSQQGNPLPPPVRGGLKPAVGHRADGGGRARRSPESSLSGKIYNPGRVARQLQWTGLIKGAIRVENVQYEVMDGNRLVIYVDLNHRGDISASGKTRRVASTEGNVGVKDANGVDVRIGLNVYVKPDI